MDFGSLNLIKRVEETVGKKPIDIFIWVFFVGLCAAVIQWISGMLWPFYKWSRNTLVGDINHYAVADAALFLFLVFIAVLGGVFFANVLQTKMLLRKTESYVDETERVLQSAESAWNTNQRNLEEIEMIKERMDRFSSLASELSVASSGDEIIEALIDFKEEDLNEKENFSPSSD